MEPVYRDGDMVIVSPSAPIRRGDRVVVRTNKGEVMAKQLTRRSARRVELKSLNPAHPDYTFDLTGRGLDAPHHLGQPVDASRLAAQDRDICAPEFPVDRVAAAHGGPMTLAVSLRSRRIGPTRCAGLVGYCSWRLSASRPRPAPRTTWTSRWCWSPTCRAASTTASSPWKSKAMPPPSPARGARRHPGRPGRARSPSPMSNSPSSFEVRTVLDWTVIRDKASAQALRRQLAAAPRSFWGRTAISAGRGSRRAVAGRKRHERRRAG